MRPGIRRLAGVWLQDKDHSFTLHYRAAGAPAARRARALLRGVWQSHRGCLRMIRTKKATKVLPASIPGKGEAVRRELARSRGALAIYAGDDVTDEDAFRAIPSGISVHVGRRRRSHARFRLRHPAEVALFLEKLVQELPLLRKGTPRSRSDARAPAS